MIVLTRGRNLLCTDCGFEAPMVPSQPWRSHACATGATSATPPATGGPGTELKRLLRRWLGVTATRGCGCNRMARRMDTKGPAWCRGEGMPEIVAAMKAEHRRRWEQGTTRLPFVEAIARRLVVIACGRA